jgi:Zn-dependent peptidase ImmA (M78 family)
MPLIVMNKRFDPVRKRLTALHELAHLLLHVPPSFTEKERERYCMRFAAAFLIPKEIFFHELGEIRKAITREELIGIKENYGISVQAIMQRAKNLGVISDRYLVQFKISIAKNRKEEGLGNYKGKEKSSRFRNLLNKSATEEIISMSKAANLANMTLSKFREEFQVI